MVSRSSAKISDVSEATCMIVKNDYIKTIELCLNKFEHKFTPDEGKQLKSVLLQLITPDEYRRLWPQR